MKSLRVLLLGQLTVMGCLFGSFGQRAMAEAEKARYPLELVSPRAAGTTPTENPTNDQSPAMPEGHRICKAHPGVDYVIRAVVVGGSDVVGCLG